MPSKNGMFLHKNTSTAIKEGLWWEEHCVRRQGGYDLDTTGIPATMRWLPKGTVLKFDATTGKAVMVKSATVYENAAKDATTLKVVDNGSLVVGDELAGSTISAISVADGVATLTVSALAAAVSKDATVSSFDSSTDTLLGLAYETTDLRDNDFPQVTPTLQAFEIEEDTLPFPIDDAIKTALGPLHQFKIG